MKPNVIINKILPIISEEDYHLLDLVSILETSEVSQKDFFSVFTDLDDLILKTFYQLCAEADGLFGKIDQSTSSLENLFQTMDDVFKLHIKYRFFIFNLLNIIKSQELIKDRYLEMIALRKSQLMHLFTQLKAEGIFIKEKFSGNFETLSNQIFMLSDYWLSHNLAVFGPDDIRLPYYSKLISSMVVPYLTEKGLDSYKKIMGYEKI